MLDVGMKVLIVGCSSPAGLQHIGKMATIHQMVEVGGVFDPMSYSGVYDEITWVGNCTAALIYSETLANDYDKDMLPEYAIFDPKNLMPIPPLEDLGIDECTFTPIVQKEHA